LGQHEKSLACYQQAISIQPEHIDARFSRAVAWLRAGNLRQGFVEYEWRWRRPDMRPQAFRQPIWDGDDLRGQPILLHAEQGFGDTIQFARYAELVAQRGGKVIVACQRQLARLLRSLPSIHQIAVDGEVIPQFVVHAPLLSLPRILGTTLETIPAAVPYLQAPPAAIALTAPPNTRAKVGIVWTGSPTHPYNYKRTCPLPEWEPLLRTPGVAFYSLQKGPQVEDLAQLPDSVQVQDLSEQLPDFAETAAAIAQLDLVITIDTSVAHLAGALGKPVWLLLDTCPDWRWLLDRDDSPWYPTMRLFRQATTGDWVEVIERVQVALQTCLDELPKTLIKDVEAAIATAIQHHQTDRWLEAAQIYRQVLQQDPQQLDALHLLGVMAHQKKNFAESRAYLTRVLTLEPNFAEAHTNLASTLREQGDFTAAINHAQIAIALNPSFANGYASLGLIYRQQGNLEQAIASYNQALALNPNDVETHWNRALVWLLAGDFRQGFAEYEWRWQRPHRRPRPFSQPLWDGGDLHGRRILLHAEQGFGDTIQFIRYVALVAERGGQVIVECQEPLLRLLQTMTGIDQLVARDSALPEFDVHASLMSLPGIVGTTLATVPATVPYLTPPDSDLRLTAAIGTLKVGLVWSGSRTNQNNHHRACPPHELRPLLAVPGISYYCLQKEKSATEWAELTEGGAEVQDLSPLLSDFAETAAAIAQLDLVITVDTAVAHLAGALGKPVWLLLTFAPDWRWMLHRQDSPWYPTMRLFRQSTPGDWAGVIQRVVTTLEQFKVVPASSVTGFGSPKNIALAGIPERGARGAETAIAPMSQAASPQSSPVPQTPPTSAAPKPIGIGWQVGLMTGWGVYGLNLTLQLLRSPSHRPMLLIPPSVTSGMMNPLHQVLLQPAIAQQQNLQGILASYPDKQIALDKPILHALGKDFASKLLPKVSGDRNIGVVFFEDTHLALEAIARAKSFEAIVAGSQWNADVLRSYGCKSVYAVPQGVDPTIFHPAPQSNLFGDRFVIFSGGKLEHRKGQDIVVAAFKRFYARHPDALLLTAWHNFWPQFMIGLDQAEHVQGLPKVSPDGRLEIVEWLTANGVPAEACVDVGPIPNHLAGQIVREADVAVFTNRAEGGTNLVAMECLACGVPTILSANTGHLDLIGSDRCYPLQTQGSVKPTPLFRGTDGWGESDVEEVVEALEQVYRDRPQAKQRAQAAATFMQDWTWEKQVQRLLNALTL
jgi:tetratricopeptide (TPR) repeat protein/glycosyltransferase involved in cell wall biosynthesis